MPIRTTRTRPETYPPPPTPLPPTPTPTPLRPPPSNKLNNICISAPTRLSSLWQRPDSLPPPLLGPKVRGLKTPSPKPATLYPTKTHTKNKSKQPTPHTPTSQIDLPSCFSTSGIQIEQGGLRWSTAWPISGLKRGNLHLAYEQSIQQLRSITTSLQRDSLQRKRQDVGRPISRP